MRTVLFLGNCQAEVLADIYRDHFAAELGDRVDFVPSITGKPELVRDRLEEADIIVEQIFDFAPPIVTRDFSIKARLVRFPCVSGAFLWPFTGRSHPHNSGSYFLLDGPYPDEMSDEFLNDAIQLGRSPAEAARAYLDLDIVAATRLDERYGLVLRWQRRRDAQAQSSAAELIEARFRDAYLFATPYHPNSELLRLLASEVAEKIGVGAECMARFEGRFLRRPVHDHWLPIHPAVAKHFGLKYISPGHRYRSLEGSFTFTEWAERYMRYEWNEPLAEGVFLARTSAPGRPPEEAIEKLRIGLMYSPDSPRGHGELADALARADHLEAAVATVRRAIQLDPEEPEFHELLGHFLARQGNLEGAVAAFRDAVARKPNDPTLLISLSHALFALNLLEDATLAATQALELSPGNAEWVRYLYKLGEALARAGHLASATATARRGIELDPEDPEFHELLGHLLVRQGNLEGAVAALRDAVARKPNDPSPLMSLSHALFALDLLDEATVAATQALELSPGEAEWVRYLYKLAEALARADLLESATATARRGIELDPDAPEFHELLGHLLVRQGNLEGAAAALRDAIARKPHDPSLLMSLSHALSALARSDEAIIAAIQAAELSPRNAGWLLHIGNLHAQRGELREAEQAFRASLKLDRDSIDAHACLAHTLVAQGQPDEAIAQLREVLARDPGNSQLTALLASLSSERQAAARSERHPAELLAIAQVREALALDPGNPRLAALLASLTSERGALEAVSGRIGEFRTLSGGRSAAE